MINHNMRITSTRTSHMGLSQKSRFVIARPHPVIARNEAIPACIGDCFVVPPRW
ncbi:MAG: hypothetical protein LBJ47_11310 [Tannerella sp.]|nr:hypothetical protein [Tannerella sp.]